MRSPGTMALLLLVACHVVYAQGETNGRITNYGEKKKPAPSRAYGCAGITNLNNMYSPAALYPAARKCVDKSEYTEAARLFSMAGAFGFYDSLRVEFEGAPQAVRYEQILAFQDVRKHKMKNFNEHLKRNFATGTRGHLELCIELRRIGPPAYHPDYMIHHGMRTQIASAQGAMRANFDGARAWEQTLIRYLGCPARE